MFHFLTNAMINQSSICCLDIGREDYATIYQNYLRVMEIYRHNQRQVPPTINSATASSSGRCNIALAIANRCRFLWVHEYCHYYFYSVRNYLKKRGEEDRYLSTWYPQEATNFEYMVVVPDRLRILDVGSATNVLGSAYNVLAIDINPQARSVIRGDFLEIRVINMVQPMFETEYFAGRSEIMNLPRGYYECVLFSLFLEYMPSSEQRIHCCHKAYELLRPEGILFIVLPDSNQFAAHSPIMNNWTYTLGCLGFLRISFVPFPYFVCLTFRKCIHPRYAQDWVTAIQTPETTFGLPLPEDMLRQLNSLPPTMANVNTSH